MLARFTKVLPDGEVTVSLDMISRSDINIDNFGNCSGREKMGVALRISDAVFYRTGCTPDGIFGMDERFVGNIVEKDKPVVKTGLGAFFLRPGAVGARRCKGVDSICLGCRVSTASAGYSRAVLDNVSELTGDEHGTTSRFHACQSYPFAIKRRR